MVQRLVVVDNHVVIVQGMPKQVKLPSVLEMDLNIHLKVGVMVGPHNTSDFFDKKWKCIPSLNIP